MPKSDSSKLEKLKTLLRKSSAQAALPVLCLFAAWLAIVPVAVAQADFTLQASSLNPDAVAPGGVTSSNITIGAVNGFSGTVALSCQVTSTVTTTDTPVCTVSPSSVTAPAGASATITTQGGTTPVSYSIVITGTGPTTTHSTSALNLTVLSVAPDFTVTVLTAVSPSSVPAGNGAEGTVSINPINGYTSPNPNDPNSGVWLSCASITPLVTIPPVCSFSPPHPIITGLAPVTSTLTISTYGPVTTGAVSAPRYFYTLWLPLPMLALAGLGAAAGGKRSRKA